MGRRDASNPPLAPPTGVVVRRSQVCLSTFYKECAETADSEPDCSCQPAERDGRSVSPLRRGLSWTSNNLSLSVFCHFYVSEHLFLSNVSRLCLLDALMEDGGETPSPQTSALSCTYTSGRSSVKNTFFPFTLQTSRNARVGRQK